MAKKGKGKKGTGAPSKPQAKAASKGDGTMLVASNRRAYHDFHVLDTLEAGLQLVGTEVKSLRDAHCQLLGSYAKVHDTKAEVWVHSINIKEYSNAGPAFQHEPQRPRKALLHKREIDKLRIRLNDVGLTLIPLKIYFRKGRAKVLLGICRSKKLHDKRESKKQQDVKRQMDRYQKG